jgi:U3 small nucleolar RNA-associated protein 18
MLQSIVSSVQFHPTAPVLLTGGLDKTLRIFQVDGKENLKIQSVYLKDLPIRCAKFTNDGREVIVSGRRKHFYCMDIEKGSTQRIFGIRGRDDQHSFEKFFVSPCNKYLVFPSKQGHISLLSKNTKQWISDLKMNSEVQDIGFSGDGQYMYSFGGIVK